MLTYLKCPNFVTRVSRENVVLKYAAKTEIRFFARDQNMRIFPIEPSTSSPPEDETEAEYIEPPLLMNCMITLRKTNVNPFRRSNGKQIATSILDGIKSGMKDYESRGGDA